MEVDFSRKERVVGVFMVGVIVVLTATVIIIGRGKGWFEKYNVYYTTFKESYNLQEGAAVRLYNAEIGKVDDITVTGDKVSVKLAVLEKYSSRIKSDTVAIVESPTFIGSEYIAIIPGSFDAPLVANGGSIQSKEKTSIGDLLDEYEVEKTAKLVVKAAQDISAVTSILRNPDGPLFATLNNLQLITADLQSITGGLEAGEGTLGALLKSNALIDAILVNLRRMDSVLTNLDLTTAKAPETMDQIQEVLTMLSEVRGLLNESLSSVKKITDKLEGNLDTIDSILKNVEAGSQDVPRITQTTRQGIQEIRDGVEEADRVVQSMQQHFLIKSNLPQRPEGQNTDAGLRR